MRIRQIEVRNFRKLIGPVIIENIADGVTIIAGDNEDGKSTVLQAVRSVLFDKHTLTGAPADAMQPFGHRVRPEVFLRFEIDGIDYELSKGFCQNPFAKLQSPTGVIAGVEVEEKLQELLRFRQPGRGQGRPEEHHGICGFFWIEQGRSFAPISLNEDNKSALAGALEGEVGQILGGARGRTLKEAIARQYREYFTETGREKRLLSESAQAVDEVVAKIGSLREQLRSYEAKVDQLAQVHERLTHYEQDGSLAKAQATLSKTQSRQEQVVALQKDVEQKRTNKMLADAGAAGPALALRHRQDAVTRAAKAADELSSARAELKLAEQEFESCNAAFQSSAAEEVDSGNLLKAAEQILGKASQAHARLGLEAEADRLNGDLVKAQEAEALAGSARARIALAKVDVAKFRHLRSLEEKWIQAKATLESSSTLVRFQFEQDGIAKIGGAIAPREGETSIIDPTQIVISGVGSLLVTPGGKELAERRKVAENSARQLDGALQALGVLSVAQAETVLEKAQIDRQLADNQAGIVAVLAPNGIAELETRIANLKTELELSKNGAEVVISLNEAHENHRLASAKADHCRTARERAQASLDTTRERRAKAQAMFASADGGAKESIAELSSARDRESDDSLREVLAQAGRQAARAETALASADAALSAEEPEKRQLEFERARDSLEVIEKDIAALRQLSNDLSIELHALGQRGLGEEAQELEGELEVATSRRKRFEREAAVLKLLYDTICDAEKRAHEAFLAPVQARMQPYLRLLLPDAEVVLSDTELGVTHLRRAGHDEPYDKLSIGAREQLAVLTRLAFADLARERGFAAPVILDDALVNSDPQRFENMLLAIRRAAKELQVIVLTCHEASWMRAGAPIIRLTGCVRQ